MQLVIGTGRAITGAVLRGKLSNFLPAPGMCQHTHYIGIDPPTPSTNGRLRITLAWLLVDLRKQDVHARYSLGKSRGVFTVTSHNGPNYWAEVFDMAFGEDALIIRLECGPPRFDVLLAIGQYQANTDTLKEVTRRIGIDCDQKFEAGTANTLITGYDLANRSAHGT